MESFIAAEACCWYIPVLRLVQELQLLPSYVSHLILSTARTRQQQRWSSFTLSPFTAGQRSEGHSPSPLPLVQKSKTSLVQLQSCLWQTELNSEYLTYHYTPELSLPIATAPL